MAQLRKQADKARQRAQERVRLGESEMLGMTPKLWLEALDEEHRHGSSLHQYWQRWEASRTRTTSMSGSVALGAPQLARHPASGATMPPTALGPRHGHRKPYSCAIVADAEAFNSQDGCSLTGLTTAGGR